CVYRSLQSGGPYTKIGTLIILNELYKDGGLDSGFTGYYVVTAVNSEGTESAYSNEASAQIPEKGSISGSIVDENGEPVSGALVELKKDDSRVLTVQSNEKGNFSIVNLDDGTYEVVINKKGYYTAIEVVVISEGTFIRLDSLALVKAPESPSEDLSVWIIPIILIIAIIAVGIGVTLVLRKKQITRKRE
ncbi:MAG: carboxypeptidase regulatory-like domain-containing protein, partial [Thermoplasmata archaeon]|nr:carboxypeptidase regulatory-like domain-containing protein [Thermoplasmata archaeon]